MRGLHQLFRLTVHVLLLTSGLHVFALLPLDRALASNSITIDSGYGLDDARLIRFNYSMGNNRQNTANDGWSWSHYWEANLSYWYLYKNIQGVDHLVEAGITPNLRVGRNQAWKWGGRPYMEAGLGAHLISKVHIGERNLGSAFQFGTHLGIGILFGSNEQWEFAWRIEHISNADLVQPNQGINFSMFRLGYYW